MCDCPIGGFISSNDNGHGQVPSNHRQSLECSGSVSVFSSCLESLRVQQTLAQSYLFVLSTVDKHCSCLKVSRYREPSLDNTALDVLVNVV